MRIGVDAMGGDYAPLEAIKGATLCRDRFVDVNFVLYGDEAVIKQVADEHNIDISGLEIIHCSEVIKMGEHPVKAIAGKKDSSIFRGFVDLAEKKTQAFFSAGNTGAMLVGSIQILKTAKGVERPALLASVPKPSFKSGIILDVGANADNKPEHIQQFAILGSIYAKYIQKIEDPKVGLVNIGEEDEKGSILSKATNQLLRNTGQINFAGNVEGRDIFKDGVDVLVCDGFTGNVIVKIIEGFYYHLTKNGVDDPFLNQLNFNDHGGGLILGVNAPVVVGHGISKSNTFIKMAELCINSVQSNFCEHVNEAFAKLLAQQSSEN